MNIQIFGKSKCFDSKSAERFFKERKIKYQYINILEKGLSIRELDGVITAVKDINLLFDRKCVLYEKLNIEYILRSVEDKKEILLLNPSLVKTPIVRECETKKCTVGSQELTWKTWIK